MKRPLLALALFAVSCSQPASPKPASPEADLARAPDLAAPTDLGGPAAPDLRPRPGWARRFGERGFSQLAALAVDAAGNVLVAASIEERNGAGSFFNRASLLKLSPGGDLLWERRLRDSFTAMTAVAADSAGNVYCGGYFGTPSVDLGGGPITKKGQGGSFLASYTPDGALRWARPVVAATSSQVWQIAVGADDELRVALTYAGALDLGRGPLPDGDGSALARYSPAGELRWARSFGKALSLRRVALGPGGAIAFGGLLSGTAQLGAVQLKSAGGTDGFVALAEADGTTRWARALGGAKEDGLFGLATDGDAIVTAGYFEGSVDLGKGPLASAGGYDILVARFDAAGALVWGRAFGGPAADQAEAVAVDGRGVLIGGRLEGDVDLGTGVLRGAGKNDAFVLALSPDGRPLLARRYASYSYDTTAAVAARGGNQYIGGYFAGTVDFGYGPLQAMGDMDPIDVFVAQLDLRY